MSYSKIKKYYFTACAVLFVLLLLLTLMRDGWTLTPQSLLSMLVGWLLLCAVIIGVVYLVVAGGAPNRAIRRTAKRQTGSNGSSGTHVRTGTYE